jgi:RNA polymerase sigma-70 factor, ECF subfamily
MVSPRPNEDLTATLAAVLDGQPGAVGRLMPILYERLRALAREQLQREDGGGAGQTLQPTALVHEAYLRLVDQRNTQWQSTAHFFAIAAQAMRRVLIDHARARNAEKRGGGRERVLLEDAEAIAPAPDLDLLALDEALTRLAVEDELASKVVEMRFFAGMEVEAIAEVLSVSDRTVRRHWVYAKAWLARELLRERNGTDAEGPQP